jgi:hypothetical protein
MSKKERETASIDDIEDAVSEEPIDTGEEEDRLPPHPVVKSPWDNAEPDEADPRDGEPSKRIYTLSVPNEEEVGGKTNPGYQLLCLDAKKFTLPPEKMIECVVLARIFPNIFQVPYTESRSMKPWEKMLGYSFTGLHPSVNLAGECFEECTNVHNNDIPYYLCSIEPPYDPSKKSRIVSLSQDKGELKVPKSKKALKAEGECPKGRWANTLDVKTRKLYGIKTDKAPPMCDKHIIFFSWHLKYEVVFASYFKRTSYPSAKTFLSTRIRGVGEGAKEYPFRAFVANISVEKEKSYARSRIDNTGEWSDPSVVEPAFNYFMENKNRFVKDLALVLEDMKKKHDAEMEFPPK